MSLKHESASEPLHNLTTAAEATFDNLARSREFMGDQSDSRYAVCTSPEPYVERELFIDNLLVRIHFIIVMIRWTGLAPRECEFPFQSSLTSTFLCQLFTFPSGTPCAVLAWNLVTLPYGNPYGNVTEYYANFPKEFLQNHLYVF